MENELLLPYVVERVKSGKTKQQIKEQLLAVGWSENDSDEAYTKALISLGVPVPSEAMQSTFAKKSSSAEVFVNLFSFVLMWVVAVSLGVLLFQVIGKYFPDKLSASSYQGRFSSDAVHYSIAALIIGFPLLYLSLKFWFRGFQQDEGKVETHLTRALTYLALLVAAIVIVGDLITTVFTFLQGEISIRFFLKALTILVISGLVFGFYYLERRKVQYRKPISQIVFKGIGLATASLIVFSIVLGFFAGGSPATERKRGFDMERARDLSSLSSCIKNYSSKYERLPESLQELNSDPSFLYCSDYTDPETGEEYSYRAVNEVKQTATTREADFELCADFSLKSENENQYSSNSQKWSEHLAGSSCDIETATLVKYKK